MFEGWIYHILAGYLGHYVRDLQREQLRIGLWKGVVLLENVELRLEAFDHLQLPFAIRSGTIGRLQLQVPWSPLHSPNVYITIQGVRVVASARTCAEWTGSAAEQRAQAAKQAALVAAELEKIPERISQVPSQSCSQSAAPPSLLLSTPPLSRVQDRRLVASLACIPSSTTVLTIALALLALLPHPLCSPMPLIFP
ncbi:hypothetical protein CYMTET_26622 [Cymbomonas tetramitiformis]|uniref:Chorein N-terminal domain-containing protein n=1 Tax=Cymbomonas tetramitiformis TaxID=36881 RepID=A0AAE0FRM8_9CHLO|nr:hypothetical protein CYMTET_26622 [Cymbomonas tetramitiformis]